MPVEQIRFFYSGGYGCFRWSKQAGAANSNNIAWQFWQQHNKPILLQTKDMAERALNYIHNNPIEAGFVEEPQHWLYSSAQDYCRRKGMLDVIIIE